MEITMKTRHMDIDLLFLQKFEELTDEELLENGGGMSTAEAIAHAISGPLYQLSSNLETATSWF